MIGKQEDTCWHKGEDTKLDNYGVDVIQINSILVPVGVVKEEEGVENNQVEFY